MKILVDTDLLIERNITIEEYCFAILINAGSDGFFQLARYVHKNPYDESLVKAIYDKGLCNYAKHVKEDDTKTMASLVPSPEFSEITEKEHLSSWIDEWLNLWPRGIMSGGYRVKSSRNDVITKMKRFRNRYPFDKGTIIEATQNYLHRFEIKGYDYIKLAKYFILKDGESTLADECETVLEDAYSPIQKTEAYGEAEL